MLVVKKTEIKQDFVNGLAAQEILAGACIDMRIFKCTLKAGKSWTPELYTYGDKTQFFFFINPTGYVATTARAYNITYQATFVPDYDSEAVVIHSGERDLEFYRFVGEMNDYDKERMDDIHIALPRFRLLTDAWQYVEGHTGGSGSGIKSHMVLEHRFLGRFSMGWNIGQGPTFIGEHTHLDLEQWYFLLPGCSMTYSAGGESVEVENGDVIYTAKGTPHGSSVREDQRIDYFWVELATDGYL